MFLVNVKEQQGMRATISLDSVWNLIQSLSVANQKWLADKVYEAINRKQTVRDLEFPHRPIDKEISPEVEAMVMDRLPMDIDIEAEKEKMWEEWAK